MGSAKEKGLFVFIHGSSVIIKDSGEHNGLFSLNENVTVVVCWLHTLRQHEKYISKTILPEHLNV